MPDVISPQTRFLLEQLFVKLRREMTERARDESNLAVTMIAPDGSMVSSGAIPNLQGDTAGAITSTSVVKLRGLPLTSDAPAVGDVLVWNGLVWAYFNIQEIELNDLLDVIITTPADGDVLAYDLATATWINIPINVGTRWEPVTNGDPNFTELIYDNGDVVMEEV